MSGIFRRFLDYLLGRGKQTELKAEVKDEVSYHDADWSKSEPFKPSNGVIDGDTSLEGLGNRNEERGIRGRPQWDTNSFNFGYREYPQPKNDLQSAVDYKWKYDYGEFTDSIIKAAGIEKMETKCEDALVCEKEPLDRATYVNGSEEDGANSDDGFFVDQKRDDDSDTTNPDPQESLPILPDLTTDESSDDDALKIENPCSQKEIKKEEGDDLPGEASACSFQSGGHLALPSMPDLDSPREDVKTKFKTPVTSDETPACQNGRDLMNNPGFCDFSRSNVMSQGSPQCPQGSPSSAPVNEERVAEADGSAPDFGKEIPPTSITKSNVTTQTISALKAITLGEMYQTFNRAKLPTSFQGRNNSPGQQAKRLMDVERHSRLVYQPDSNSLETPPNSPVSGADTTFNTADSRISGGNGSPGPVTPAHHPPGSPWNPFQIRMVNQNNPAAVSATPNRKFVLVKSKVDSGLPKAPVCSFTLVTPALPKAIVKRDNTGNGFVASKSSSSKCPPKMSAKTAWPGTPRPASKAQNSGLAGVAHLMRPGDQPKGQICVTPSPVAPKSEPKNSANQTSRDGKRIRSDVKTQDHTPSKKRKVDLRPNAVPARPLRSRIPSSILNSPRSMRRRNPSVVYKS